MRLTRVHVQHWRHLDDFDCTLEAGLNVLCGLNETGKSTILEAIHHALFWSTKARKTEALAQLVPVQQIGVVPTVEVDLEGNGWSAVVRKQIALKPRDRRVVLRLRDPRQAERSFTGEEAERQLAERLAAEGGEDIFSARQDRPYRFMEQELPKIARDALGALEQGVQLAGARLARMQAALRQEREQRLVKRFHPEVRTMFRASTQGQIARKNLEENEAATTKCRQDLEEVEALRQSIVQLRRRAETAKQEIADAEKQLRGLGENSQAQNRARLELERRRGVLQQRQRTLQEAQDRADTRERLRREINECAARIAVLEPEVQQLREDERDLDGKYGRFQEERKDVDNRRAEVQRRLRVLDELRNLAEATREQERLTHALARLEQAQHARQQAKDVLAALPPCPTAETLKSVRKVYAEYTALVRQASEKLQITITPFRPLRLVWCSDEGHEHNAEIGPESEETLHAVCGIRIEIADVATIRIHCGAEELRQLLDRIKRQREQLEQQLQPFGIPLDTLDGDGFERLETLAANLVEATRRVAEAQEQYAALERELGCEKTLRVSISQQQEREKAAREALQLAENPLIGQMDDQGREQARKAAQDASVDLERRWRELDRDLKETQETRVRVASQLAKAETELRGTREKHAQAAQELAELEADGQTPDERDAALQRLRVDVANAEQAVRDAENTLELLGEPITEYALNSARTNIEQRRMALEKDELERARREAMLSVLCGKDPQSELERLASERVSLERELARHEREAKGLLLLLAVLDAEHRRASGQLAEPLNRCVEPWLTALRGRPTQLVLDHNSGRVTGIRSEEEGTPVSLEFAQLSEGTREQIALLVRLALARALSDRLGQEPLPLVLDDPLANTDPRRRKALFRLLAEAAAEVQLLYVTCQEDTLAQLPETAHVIRL